MTRLYQYFMPQSNYKLLVWLGTYRSKISIHGPSVGMSASDVTEVQDASQTLIDAIQLVDTRAKELDSARSALAVCKQVQMKKIIQKTGVIKRHPDYNETIGSDLGIIGKSQAVDLETVRPAIKLSVFPGAVEVSFQLQGMRGVTIYSRTKGTLGWERITHDYESPYIDSRPLAQANTPEIREYMARFFNGREDVGRESDVAVCVYGG